MIPCPNCGEDNPERARFCLNCGAPLGTPEAAPQARKERKFATALFADLVGSTTLAEREDPEVVQAVVGRAFDRLSQEVDRYGGLLEKFMGDAVLAVFGVPKAHEDDPERAVRAGIEMQAVLSELNRSFLAEGKPELAMRVGVEAGEVLVDLERAAGARDRMLTGDAVNTAARLQTVASPGHVVVGPGVFASTKEVIDYRELAPLELKGKAELVPAWDALRVRAKRRGVRPALGLESRLIGRDEELTVLKQTLHRVGSEGRPALVTIVGPAGVGKSRLMTELLRHVEGLPEFIYWRTGRCLAYGNTSYSALADAIKAQCEILDDDDAETAAEKVDAVVRELFGDDAVASHIRALVAGSIDRSVSREELFETWRRFLERMAARYPLVLVLEDIHWADEGLLDFIEHVADWAQGPILLLAMARPELFDVRPTWGGGKRNAASISLDPLTPDEDAAMVDDLLSGAVPDDLRKLIVDRAEGNPLYTEEIVRTLIDEGVLRATEASRWEVARRIEDVELPRSIQGLIAARLDGLPDDEKAILQDASVVGRIFWTGAVAKLSGRHPREVREALGRLRVKELVLPHDPSSFSDEEEFSFRHLLIRDGAYDSLPKSLRAEKHAAVAEWAESRAGDRADEIAEVIATHRLEALGYLEELGETASEDDLRASYRWAVAAGDRALALWLRAEAVRWYSRALDVGERAGIPVEERAAVAKRLVRTGWGTISNEEHERDIRRALALFEAAGDERGAGWATAQLSQTTFRQGRDKEANQLGDLAVARLEPLGDSEELAEALHILGWFHWRRGNAEEAEEPLRRSVAMAARVGALRVRAGVTQTLAVHLTHVGKTEEALQVMEEAYVLAKEAGDQSNLLRIYNNLPSTLADFASDYRRASEIAREGLEVARKAGSGGNAAWILGTLADITAFLGEIDESERMQREAIDMSVVARDEPLLGMRHQALAWVLLLQDRLDEAEAAMEEGIAHLGTDPEPQTLLYTAGPRASLAAARGRDEEAIEILRQGIETARHYTVDQEPAMFVDLVRRLLAEGRREEAMTYRDLTELGWTPNARACAAAVEGLLAEDPQEAIRRLREAAEGLEAVGRRIDLARVLLDTGRAEAQAGQDPRATFERARDLLVECGARLYLPEAKEELARLG